MSTNMLQYCVQKGLPSKFIHYPKKLGDLTTPRNEMAHDTGKAFASLLCSPFLREDSLYDEWAGIFPFVYNSTVEEMAVEEMAVEDMAVDDMA